MQLAIKKLDTLARTDTDAKIAIIEQSIANGWIGLFPLKNESQGGMQTSGRYDDLAEWASEHKEGEV